MKFFDVALTISSLCLVCHASNAFVFSDKKCTARELPDYSSYPKAQALADARPNGRLSWWLTGHASNENFDDLDESLYMPEFDLCIRNNIKDYNKTLKVDRVYINQPTWLGFSFPKEEKTILKVEVFNRPPSNAVSTHNPEASSDPKNAWPNLNTTEEDKSLELTFNKPLSKISGYVDGPSATPWGTVFRTKAQLLELFPTSSIPSIIGKYVALMEIKLVNQSRPILVISRLDFLEDQATSSNDQPGKIEYQSPDGKPVIESVKISIRRIEDGKMQPLEYYNFALSSLILTPYSIKNFEN